MKRSYDWRVGSVVVRCELRPMTESALFALPKVELHCHLELAFRKTTLKNWALQRGMAVDTEHAFENEFLIKSPMADLPSVLHKFLNARDVIDNEAKVEQLAFEACEDMHRISNVRVLELRYAPSFLLDAHPDMNADLMLEAILRGITRAERKYPMVVGLIGLLQRIKSVQENERWCDWILERKAHFVGLDLADDEVHYPAHPFASLFQKAKAQGLGITVHAGEPDVPQAAQNILVALDKLGADRIGHGVQAIQDEEVMARLVQDRIPLELCPWSNVLTRAVSSLTNHPFKELLKRGIRTTLNTDDPGVMDISLVDQCRHVMTHLDISIENLMQCNEWAREASFISQERIQSVWPNNKS